MAAKTLVFEELFEVVGHAHQVELDHTLFEVNPCRMDISEDHVSLMDMFDAQGELPEDGYGLAQVELALAEALPVGDVVRCFAGELDEATGCLVV